MRPIIVPVINGVFTPIMIGAHGQSDSIEGITHSVCTLEFEQHRPLYDWYIGQLEVHHPQQIEFAKLVISNTMMSKRKLTELVAGGFVEGWDDPRMPTISGFSQEGIYSRVHSKFCETCWYYQAQ